MTHAEYMKQWRADNPERWREIHKKACAKYRAKKKDDPEYREKQLERLRRYRNSTEGKVKRAEAQRRRYLRTKELDIKKRKARKHGLTLVQLNYFLSNACTWCGSTEYIQIDHMHPSSKGGSNAPDNLQSLCSTCNSFKGDRLVTAGSSPGILVGV